MSKPLLTALLFFVAAAAFCDDSPRVAFEDSPAKGRMHILVDGREALVYRYGDDQDMVHFHPVLSPDGQPMTVQRTDPYPHHRSFWFADKVQLEDRRTVEFYGALYSSASGRQDPKPPFKDHIRHLEFLPANCEGNQGTLTARLVWEMDGDQPVLDETRTMRVVALDRGQWILDVTFSLTASHGEVKFVSDAVHYAWPYVRMNTAFSVEGGGTITNSAGGVNQAGTNNKPARWVDYSNTVDGKTSGLAIFPHPTTGPESPLWLTRDYGCFGPRREAEKSGKPFSLARGESISQRVGVFVHRGNAEQGRVAERYSQFVSGELQERL